MITLNYGCKNSYKSLSIVALALCAVSALCAVFAVAQAAERPVVGHAIKLEGGADAVFKNVPRTLKTGSPVLFEDLIRTSYGGRLSVEFADGSDITLGESASVLIDSFVYQPENSLGTLVLQVLHGAFLFVGGKIENIPDARVSISTPVATLGIRGTKVWAGKIDSGYGVLTLDGQVVVSNAVGSVTLGPGEGTMITDGNPPSQPVVWPEEKTQRALNATNHSQ